jgi:hypothetical protein
MQASKRIMSTTDGNRWNTKNQSIHRDYKKRKQNKQI